MGICYEPRSDFLHGLFNFVLSPDSVCDRWTLLVPVPWVRPPGWFKLYRLHPTHTPPTSPCCLRHRPACTSAGRYWNKLTHRDTQQNLITSICTHYLYSNSVSYLTDGDFVLCVCVHMYVRVHSSTSCLNRLNGWKPIISVSWLSVLTLICHISHSVRTASSTNCNVIFSSLSFFSLSFLLYIPLCIPASLYFTSPSPLLL